MKNKVVIGGAGLTGCVVARILAEAGFPVTIHEKRLHVGGNIFDFYDDNGILIQKYGPHIFHTNKKEVREFVERYSNWIPFQLTCGAVINELTVPTPFNFTTIDLFYRAEEAEKIKNFLKKNFPSDSVPVLELIESRIPEIKNYGDFLFHNDYAPYTAKQWGMKAEDVDPQVLKRVPVNLSYESGYFKDSFQAMPEKSFSAFVSSLLSHSNIEVITNSNLRKLLDFKESKIHYSNSEDCILIFTGPIDQLFSESFGRLPYRTLNFEYKFLNMNSFQEYPVVAHPKAKGYTRITEYKKLTGQNVSGTVIGFEFPVPYLSSENEPYYPVSTTASANLYKKYKEEASKFSNLYLAGRLGKFLYLNMDQAIFEAMELAELIKRKYG